MTTTNTNRLRVAVAALGLIFTLCALSCSNPLMAAIIDMKDAWDLDQAMPMRITDFTLAGVKGSIDLETRTISVNLSGSIPLSSLAPAIASKGGTLYPSSGTAQDFQKPVLYTLTDASGATQQWRVVVAQLVAAATNTYLKSLTTSLGALDPPFNKAISSYTVFVPETTTDITINAEPENALKPVSYSKSPVSIGLTSGANFLAITVDPTGTPRTYTVTVFRHKHTEMSMVNVPAGVFQRDADPANTCAISAFSMIDREITNSLYNQVMTSASGDDCPVPSKSWYDAIVFCNVASLNMGLKPVYYVKGTADPYVWDGTHDVTISAPSGTENTDWKSVVCDWSANGYRLPTEMEWMWAAMGATSCSGYMGGINAEGYKKAYAGDPKYLSDYYAQYGQPYLTGSCTAVDGKAMNELGIRGLSGNVFEWCWDFSGDTAKPYYTNGSLINPRGCASGVGRVYRGGCYFEPVDKCTIAYRGEAGTRGVSKGIGFRVVRNVP